MKPVIRTCSKILRGLKVNRAILIAFVLIGFFDKAQATDLTVHLTGTAPLSRQLVRYQCDATGTKMGLPAGPFSVEYINGGGNSLAVLPLSGKSVIFANVVSGSGARYAAQQFIWWEAAGRSITLSSDSIAGKMQSTCQRVTTP